MIQQYRFTDMLRRRVAISLLVKRREFHVTAARVLQEGYANLTTYNVFLKDSPLEVLNITQRQIQVYDYDTDKKPQLVWVIVCDAWVMDTLTGATYIVTLRPEQLLTVEREGEGEDTAMQ